VLAAMGQPDKVLDTCNTMVTRRQDLLNQAAGDDRSDEQGLLRVALTRRARAHLGLEDLGAAETDLKAAADLPGAGVEPEMRLSRMYMNSGRYALAAPVLRDALAVDPENAEALYELARADLSIGDEEGARRVLDHHLQQNVRGRALKLALDASDL